MHGRCKYEYKTITQLWRIDFLFSVVWRPPSVNFTFDKQTPRWIASSELQFFLSSSLKSSTLFQEIEPVSFYSNWIFLGSIFLSYLLNSRFKLHPFQPLQRSKQSSEGIWKFLFSEQFERNIMASKSLFPYQRFGGFLKNWLPQMFQNLSLLSKQLSLLKCPSRDKV